MWNKERLKFPEETFAYDLTLIGIDLEPLYETTRGLQHPESTKALYTFIYEYAERLFKVAGCEANGAYRPELESEIRDAASRVLVRLNDFSVSDPKGAYDFRGFLDHIRKLRPRSRVIDQDGEHILRDTFVEFLNCRLRPEHWAEINTDRKETVTLVNATDSVAHQMLKLAAGATRSRFTGVVRVRRFWWAAGCEVPRLGANPKLVINEGQVAVRGGRGRTVCGTLAIEPKVPVAGEQLTRAQTFAGIIEAFGPNVGVERGGRIRLPATVFESEGYQFANHLRPFVAARPDLFLVSLAPSSDSRELPQLYLEGQLSDEQTA